MSTGNEEWRVELSPSYDVIAANNFVLEGDKAYWIATVKADEGPFTDEHVLNVVDLRSKSLEFSSPSPEPCSNISISSGRLFWVEWDFFHSGQNTSIVAVDYKEVDFFDEISK